MRKNTVISGSVDLQIGSNVALEKRFFGGMPSVVIVVTLGGRDVADG